MRPVAMVMATNPVTVEDAKDISWYIAEFQPPEVQQGAPLYNIM